jgi:hypothetical protein
MSACGLLAALLAAGCSSGKTSRVTTSDSSVTDPGTSASPPGHKKAASHRKPANHPKAPHTRQPKSGTAHKQPKQPQPPVPN